jgi:hypothetical protein
LTLYECAQVTAPITIPQAAVDVYKGSWHNDWIYGVPLILLTIFLHVFVLGAVSRSVIRSYGNIRAKRFPMFIFAIVIGTSTLIAITLHAFETGLWAAAYLKIGAITSFRSSMLYSLGAMTTYGHENLDLAEHWRLMGAIEALNGWLLFGLSTAFLFEMIQKISPGRGEDC